jgi:transcriptional regulator with XRE-family HTH domain
MTTTKLSKLPKFATRLAEARREKNYSLRECEKRTGGKLSRQAFLRAEKGEVTLENLVAMFKVLSIPKTEHNELQLSWMNWEMNSAKAA